jgi:predicted nucleic acid-binding protein
MAATAEFLDSNVLVYAFSTDPRSVVSEELLARGCTVSVQGLNEFANIARRKLGMSWLETNSALAAIRVLCGAVRPIHPATHVSAMGIAEAYQLSIFDAVMLASALEGGCGLFWSEDMQDGQLIEGKLQIANPYRLR